MLWLKHREAARGFDARFSQFELRTPDFIVYRQRLEGGGFDERLEPAAAHGESWSRVAVVLAGEILARPASPVILGPGAILAAPRWNDGRVHHLTRTSDVLFFAWRAPGPIGPLAPAGSLPASSGSVREVMARLAGALAGDDAHVLDEAAASARRALGALGLPLDEDAVLASARSIEPWHRRFAAALESVLFPLANKPMLVDLGRRLGLGDRQVLRLANEYFSRFHVTVDAWREYVSGMRLELGMFFSSHPEARTESISRTLGFSSPTALCHAFQAAGLPSPQQVRREVGALDRRGPWVPTDLVQAAGW